MAPVAMATASDIVIARRQSLAASRDRGIHRAISQRIPGRSVSGEPGPTLLVTCRKTMRSLMILMRLQCE
ncbi:hypothetical protein ABB55_07515 [Prosthecomicrobium hirschii]|uniref:Uncharacterized protein n=1 Tax=Prosthecodimorpha hirschii TaxID=665126 RepID=A0A0P6W3Y6_9HYPH|nr:hypothetical protein ABB55_07515 [Prosthecomicrobium hirschii]